MDTKRILTELHAERNRIDKAIVALEALDTTGARATRITRTAAPKQRRGRRRMSAATRRKLSQLAKARWAERKKKTLQPQASAKQAVPKQLPARRRISAAGRKRIAEAARKMWVERRKRAKTA